MTMPLFIFRVLVAFLLGFCFSIGPSRADEAGSKAPSADLKTPPVEVKAPSADLKTPPVEVKAPSADLKTPSVDLKSPPSDLNDWAAVRAYGLAKLDAGKFKSAAKYLGMARSLAEKKSIHSDQYLTSTEDLAKLDEARGRYWQACNAYNQLFTDLSQKPNSESNVKVAVLQAHLGRLNYLLGDLPQARMQLEKALVAFNNLNDESLEKARALRDLCQVHLDFGLFDRARREAKQALELSEKHAGSKSLEACESLISLARTEIYAAQLEQAETYIRQAMAIPVDNSRIASLARSDCFNTCAQIYLDEGRSAQAMTLEEEALSIRQKSCGENHPATAECLTTLGIIAIAQKDYDSAKVFLEKSMTIAQDCFGPDSAKVAKILAIQATCAKSKGASDEAKASFSKASEIANKLSVLDNPQVKNLRDLISGSPEQSQPFWESKKADTSYPLDPLSRCVVSLLTKGVIERPVAPKQTESEPAETPTAQSPAQPSPESAGQPSAITPEQKSLPTKFKIDPKFLWGLAIIVIPIIMLVVFSVFSNFFRSLKSTVRRPQRRGPGKGADSPNEPDDTASKKDGSGQMMSRFVDGHKVNKFWDINR